MRRVPWFVGGFLLALAMAVGVMLGAQQPTSAEGSSPTAVPPTAAPTSVSVPTDQPAPTFTASLRWHREWVFSGGCDGLRVEKVSQVHYAPCDQGPRLGCFAQDELRTYLVYVARYAPFEYVSQCAGSTLEETKVHLSFGGRGNLLPTDAEQAEVADWVGSVYDRLMQEEQQAELVARARTLLAQCLEVYPDAIQTLSVEPVTWSDACLEIESAGIYCAQVRTPGYRIVLKVGSTRWEFRTNMHDLVRQVESSLPAPTQSLPTMAPTVAPTATSLPTPTPQPDTAPKPKH